MSDEHKRRQNGSGESGGSEESRTAREKGVDPDNVYVTGTHAAILADIVGHPYQLPTLPELVYTNRKRDKHAVKRSLKELIHEGLVEEVRFEEGSPHPRHPELFFGITEYGRSVLFSRIPEENERTLQAAYARAEKPEDIKRFERAPRPPRPIGGTDSSGRSRDNPNPSGTPGEDLGSPGHSDGTPGTDTGPGQADHELDSDDGLEFGGRSEDLLDALDDEDAETERE